MGGEAEAQQAVRESFARSVIWGFEVVAGKDDAVIIDITEFLLRDAHGIGALLEVLEAGIYAVAPERSSVMDYPFRLIRFNEDGDLDLRDAYAIGAGPRGH